MKHFSFLKKLDIKKILSSLRPSKAEGKEQSQAKNAKSFFSSDGAAVLICLLIAVCMWFSNCRLSSAEVCIVAAVLVGVPDSRRALPV